MRGTVAKELRKLARKLGRTKKEFKRKWMNLPWTLRSVKLLKEKNGSKNLL